MLRDHNGSADKATQKTWSKVESKISYLSRPLQCGLCFATVEAGRMAIPIVCSPCQHVFCYVCFAGRGSVHDVNSAAREEEDGVGGKYGEPPSDEVVEFDNSNGTTGRRERDGPLLFNQADKLSAFSKMLERDCSCPTCGEKVDKVGHLRLI